MKIGVLALQGSVAEHLRALAECGVDGVAVRKAADLDEVAGLILPGGESTTIGRLCRLGGLDVRIRERAAAGMPIYGTCAGMILLAKRIAGEPGAHLGLMDIDVARNAFGRQVESFETDLCVPELGEAPVRAVFIRAPYATAAGPGVQVLARLDDTKIVFARQGPFLASAFHPELTDDRRIHRYFLSMVEEATATGHARFQ
ncbi:MAG TPA: pyridoxal 5'-phosphate synthase glutaminase subunit PdxT [Limnochordia bacterium]